MINSISIAVTGLAAASRKLNASASNIANSQTTGSLDPAAEKQAYTPVDVVNMSAPGGGVMARYTNRIPPTVPSFDPNAPYANEEGLVSAPNINLDQELMTGLIAENAYKANAMVIKTASEMQNELIRALDEEA
jgi:flagellar basal-body rod protein FlgC